VSAAHDREVLDGSYGSRSGNGPVPVWRFHLRRDLHGADHRLYAEDLSWNAAGERWHAERRAGRGSRESAQKILHLIRQRLNAAGGSLPSLRQLVRILETESSGTARAQVLYLYLIEADGLVQFALHGILREQGLDRSSWELSNDRIRGYLDAFRYRDGSPLEYADSTLNRWIRGFRSVLLDINVREGKYSDRGDTPSLNDGPLAVSSGYSWHQEHDGWEQLPLGWMYLFQPEPDWSSLRARLREFPGWEESRTPRGNYLRPTGDPFAPEAIAR